MKDNNSYSSEEVRSGLILVITIGVLCTAFTHMLHSSLFDPLLVSLLLGILIGSSSMDMRKYQPGIARAISVFIPVGIVFYGLSSLNFARITEVEPSRLILIIAVMVIYFAVILLSGRLLKQRKQITYLTASGSAICGASAIAVASPAIEAEPDDVSISLLSVAIAAFVGFALVIPFIAALLDIKCRDFCFLSGSTLQFTGLVKIAERYTPFLRKDMQASEMLSLALTVKSVRYLGLLVVIPLFSSLVKKKLTFPWFLWAFLAAGVAGTWLYSIEGTRVHSKIVPYINPIHVISWSIAMTSIGLKADVKKLLSNNGAKALIMAFAGFFAAIFTFLAGIYFTL
ncbi:MAG: putative sulfate exporter family transporter [Nitrospiraceae bacterium]|nr:MAG: putative sulfate exporter family transporter [Nitrospiraceae bacterium]